MLFNYQYINHSLEKMQELIDYIFYEVWCKAPYKDYDITLFDNNTELQGIIKNFQDSKSDGAKIFIDGIKEVFSIFKTISQGDINQLKSWYRANNNIEALCKSDPEINPATYSDINRLNPSLGAALEAFFDKLYSNEFLTLKTLSDKIGFLSDHYKKFITINNKGKCPFCGLIPMDGKYVHTREAYDHYLPVSKYPFSSINFKNLAPICYKCNSRGYKGSKDPLHDKNGNRRKSFYSYSSIPYTLEINLTLNSSDVANLTPQDITITFGPTSLEEEIQTWKELFGIEERYKDTYCSVDAKEWITDIIECCGDMSQREYLSTRLKNAQRCPYTDTNFLRKPFLEACEAQHVFR